jgi:predicted nucleic acid-binding protein
MVLVDTSVWINHFRKGDPILPALLEKGNVATHEFIIGELACGNFKNYSEIMILLKNLHLAKRVTSDELLLFIERNKLSGKGIGFVDVHLLASSKLSGYPLLTYDKKLSAIASELTLQYSF